MQDTMQYTEIASLKKKKNAIVLAHNYQVQEVQAAADFIGDSLELSRKAAQTDARMIVFAGVKFMAETAKVLAPQKKVLLPRLDAGCPMADMITVDELRELKREHANAVVVTYVNSSVEIKAESDICCTSANAVQIVQKLKAEEIIFIPDQNLGSYVQKKVPNKKIITLEGYCYVHNRIKKWEVEEMKKFHPGALILAHPEVRPEIIDLADEVLSTSGMLKYAKSSFHKDFIVLTEEGLLERMRKENPGKSFYPSFRPKICSNMKKTSLEDVYRSLAEEKYEMIIDDQLMKRAFHALDAMIKFI